MSDLSEMEKMHISLNSRIAELESQLVEQYEARERLEAQIEQIQDEWATAIQSDLEHGVKWLNEEAAKRFAENYPELCKFAEFLNSLSIAATPDIGQEG